MSIRAVIWTEGKTDWQHLKRSFKALGASGGIAFKEHEAEFGDDKLLKQCAASAREAHSIPAIFVFDRDKPDIVAQVEEPGLSYKRWGNSVYSLAIPVPSHRLAENGICIELCYTDEELATPDGNGRRLFLSTEFNSKSGRHKVLDLNCLDRNKLMPDGRGTIRIIDSEVFDGNSTNVALSKADFARYVFEEHDSFKDLRATRFQPVLKIIEGIIEDAQPRHSPAFQDLPRFIEGLRDLPAHAQLSQALEAAIQMARLMCTLYVASIIRFYEARIRTEDPPDRKKAKPIKLLLSENSLQPSLASIQKLVKAAQHIIDESAPSEVLMLRGVMMSTHSLGPLGQLFDLLDKCFPPPRRGGRIVQKTLAHKPILDFVVTELAKYEPRVHALASGDEFTSILGSDTMQVCEDALQHLSSLFEPIDSLVLQERVVNSVRNVTGEFDVMVTRYKSGKKYAESITKPLDAAPQDQLEVFEFVASLEDSEVELDLSPFVILRQDYLFYFNRKTAEGYEYAAPFKIDAIQIPTRRKFDREALRSSASADGQSFFWAHVEPTVNALNVRANIPVQEKIVGRKKQLAEIMEDILLIPNRDGIIYGPGGVGKTALLIDLTWQLYENPPEELTFSNIIWVSAKEDYLDPLFETVEKSKQRVTSLDNVLTSVLEFHDIEDGASYSAEGKQWLVGELCKEGKSLIVIDNFETIAADQQRQILRFFGTEIKRTLRAGPDNCRVLITSRETIPSGFFQFDLRGLDPDESIELMNRLYIPYVHSRIPMLTAEQMNNLYDATKGVPLLIKHSFGKIYEFGQQVDTVIKNLSAAGNKAIEFSFSEMLKLLETDELQLRVFMLLEIVGRPLIARHISVVLGGAEEEIKERLIRLSNYHCVFRLIDGSIEKYSIADEAHTFSKRMVLENPDLSRTIRGQLSRLTYDERLDYSTEEYDASMDFERLVAQRQYLAAEDFMKEALVKRAKSVLLNLRYARYLREKKRKPREALDRLELVREGSGHATEVLRLMMKCHSELEPPDFEHADVLANELKNAADDMGVKFDLAEFYVRWSSHLKQRTELDPIKNMLRTQKYKELADQAIERLSKTNVNTYEKYYLLANAHFNLWQNDRALQSIDAAIRHLPKESKLRESYHLFRHEIVKRLERNEGPIE